MAVSKDSIEIKIDGETLKFKLTATQKAQLKRATTKVTAVDNTPIPHFGVFTLACKTPRLEEDSYPMVVFHGSKLSTTLKLKGFTGHTTNPGYYNGRDFNLPELKTFIRDLKTYAAKIWDTAEEELKSV